MQIDEPMLAIQCPACSARIGHPCTQVRWARVSENAHEKRVKRAQELYADGKLVWTVLGWEERL